MGSIMCRRHTGGSTSNGNGINPLCLVQLPVVAALVIVAVSVVALVAFIIAASVSEQEETATMVGRICYFPWVVWSVMLGMNLLKRRA